MGKIILATESAPTTPAAGLARIWIDSTAKILCFKDDTGLVGARSENASIADLALNSVDTYLTNSDIKIPSFGPQVGSMIRWIVSASKTAAGVATPTYNVRIGSLRTTADTSRLLLTGPAQTAAIDQGVFSIYLTFRSIGAAGILRGDMNFDHNLAATGFAINATAAVGAASAGFDNTAAALAGLFIGLSVNPGASGVWTVTNVRSEAKW